MTTKTVKIEDLCSWSEPKRVRTKHGPRDLCKAEPGEDFWAAWRSSKAQLKEAGVSVGKEAGVWEALWWRPIPEDEAEQIEQAKAASRATDADIDVPCPDGLEYLPYQRAGIAYALQREAVLVGDEMGLGKTIQAIGVWNSDSSIKRTLVVCPASLRLNWRNEFKKWATRDCRIEVIKGGTASARPLDGWDVLIVNYDVLAKHKDWLQQFDFDLLISDEVHYCKNPQTGRTKALLGYVPRKGQRTQPEAPIRAKRRIFLTGTPIVNRPVELWPLLQSLDPQGLGRSFFRYAQQYCAAKQTRWGWDFSGASNLPELQSILRERFMVRRLKKDVLTELPPKTRQVIELPANGASKIVAEEQHVYSSHRAYIEELEAKLRQAELEAVADLDGYELCGQDELAQIRSQLSQARQTAFSEMSIIRHKVALAKVPKVAEHLLSALDEGPVVCFAHHRDVVDQIRADVEADKDSSHRVATITGDTPLEARQRAVEMFQAGELDLIIGNIQAAGVGLTLTRSSRVVFAELDWVPGNLTQAEDRCHRIGQRDNVLVQHLVLENSLDAEMISKLIAKQEVIDQALDRDVPTEERAVEVTEVEITPDQLTKRGERMSAAQVAAVHDCLRMLAGVCDGARRKDGCGFNGVDSRFGKALAAQPQLTPRQAAIGLQMVHKYHRQLPAELLARAKGETK